MSYLPGKAEELLQACCGGVSSIKESTHTKEDRQTAYECVKDVAGKISGLKDDAAQELPSKCKVEIKVPISKTVD
ncbi:hypothetical protein CsatB_020344 [Cannabis sativa]